MRAPAVVLIVRGEHIPRFRARLGDDTSVALFADSASLQALDAILEGCPKIVALDRAFVTTARGAVLVARVKATPKLASVDLRVLTQDETQTPRVLVDRAASSEALLLQGSQPLDRCGTRRAARFPMDGPVTIVVNGERSQLLNLSITGAQLLVPLRVCPKEPVRLTLLDGAAETRLRGVVVWAVAEPIGAALRYRAGVQFLSPDSAILEAFCVRHGRSPDPTFHAGEPSLATA